MSILDERARAERAGAQRSGYMFFKETDSEAAQRLLGQIAAATRELTERGEAAATLGSDATQVLRRIAARQPVPEATLDRALAAAGHLEKMLVFQILKRFPRASA